MSNRNEHDVYIIPPNFIEGGTLFGGMFKLRNAIEAGVIALIIGYPVMQINMSLTARIVILCVTALPLGIFGLLGINGECLSSFVISFFKFLKNRRVIGEAKKGKKQKESAFINTAAECVPIEKIQNGIIYTKDHRYVKIIEVLPINFLLRNAREQRNIIYSFVSYLKICPVKMQFKVLAKKADTKRHTDIVLKEIENEDDENCRKLQSDYLDLLNRIGSREATTRRFFIAFEYETYGRRSKDEESEAIASLQTAARTAMNFLKQCGNEVLIPDNEDEFTVDVLYNILCREESVRFSLKDRVQRVVSEYVKAEKDTSAIPDAEFFAPQKIDVTHGSYINVDGLYQSYFIIPSFGYKAQVPAGWLTLLVNAGDGIDMDLFLFKQPKEQMVRRLGQQIRINRSKIKEASDTNTDFDDLDGAISSGYFLKEGLSNNEDFYYMSLLITVTAYSADDLEWRERELRKLLVSQDIGIGTCIFRQEQALMSSLPLVSLDKSLYERAKRNVLTTGAASCYPFTAYEMCDDNGILLGVNKINNSLVIVDIFNSAVYRNANISIIGTSGAGKTFTMQLMALRMRRKGIQVFIIAPLKGHEFHRACKNTGGEFIQISPASKNCINVMEIRKTDKTADELIDGSPLERSELAHKIQQLHIFFGLLIPDMNHEEKQLLDEALIKTYALKGITHENISLIDEMWQLIGSSGNRIAAEFVLEMFKIIRGYGGSAICGTQDLNDFFALEDGKYGKGIINNCKTKIILNLEDDEAQRVKDIFKLSEAEIMEITHFERGNGLISTNNNNITVEFKCSELEKSLITTDRRELRQILENKKGVIQT